MPTEYQQFTKTEFESKLAEIASFEEIHPPDTKEVVYEMTLPHDELSIRLYSSIYKGKVREKGEDAIRCVIWSDKLDRPVGGQKKTLRIAPTESNPEGWFGNLKPKIRELYKNWRSYDNLCPECSARMVVREPPAGASWTAFYGCSGYPECEHTEDL